MDRAELRLKNVRRTGDVLPNGDRLDSCGLTEGIEKIVDATNWKQKQALGDSRGIGIGTSAMFNGKITGVEITRELDSHENTFLHDTYSHLNEEQMNELLKILSYIHTGEMVPFYIMRYGFYEGHTSYRADPIAISFIFGLRSIEEIVNAFKGNLYDILTDHFIGPR